MSAILGFLDLIGGQPLFIAFVVLAACITIVQAIIVWRGR